MKHFKESLKHIEGAAWKHGEKFNIKKHAHTIRKK